MAAPKRVYATLRNRRQITLPPDVCERLRLTEGDRLEVSVTEGGVLLRPAAAGALDALRALQRALRDSGVTEAEMQDEARRVRDEVVREKYGLS